MNKQQVFELSLEYLNTLAQTWKVPSDYWYKRSQVVTDTMAIRDWFIDFYIRGYAKSLGESEQKAFLEETVDWSIVRQKETNTHPVITLHAEAVAQNNQQLKTTLTEIITSLKYEQKI